MNLVERAKNICLTPATEWPVISGESIPNATVITSYVVPLAAVSAVAGFVGGSVIGRTLPFIGTYRVPFATGLGVAVFTVIMAVLGVYLVGIIIDALAPTFGAQKNSAQAFKVAAYSFTPAWIGGVFQVLPVLGILALLGALYGIYLLYLGLPRLMRCPDDKAIGYTAVVVICAIVVSAVVGTVVGTVTGMGMMGAGLMSGAALGGAGGPTASADPNSTLGRLEQFGRAMENSAKKGRPRRTAVTRREPRARRPRAWALCSVAATASNPSTSRSSSRSCPKRSRVSRGAAARRRRRPSASPSRAPKVNTATAARRTSRWRSSTPAAWAA